MTDKVRGSATRALLTPQRKQVFLLDVSPSRRGETPNSHPALFLTDARFNATGVAIVCLGKRARLGSAFAVEVPASLKLGFEGFFHSTHLRTVAFRERNPRLLGVMPNELLDDIVQVIVDLVDPDSEREVTR